MKIIRKHGFTLLTFVVAFIVMTVAFAKEGLFPFGDKQIMIIDSWHQYFPILQEFHHKLQSGQSLFYSWNSGSGTNFLLMMGYYALSPLNFLSIVVPKEFLREFMLFATITKIALAGTFFSIYIKGLFNKNDLSVTIFGLSYAFSAFLMGYYWDIMWLDCVALLPLIILGLHHIFDNRGFVLFTSTLAIALVSNFYIGYFICEFIAIYAFVLYFLKFSAKSRSFFFVKMSKVIFFSILGVGLSMITLIPVMLGMGRAYGYSSGDPKTIQTYQALLDIINNLLINVKPTIVDGLPNIYAGMVVLLFAIFYFFVSNISIRAKVINAVLLLFLLLSMNINYLNFVWHGFHFPNQVPYRFAFVFSFVIITLAYESFINLEYINEQLILKIGCLFVAYLLICEKLYSTLFDFKIFYLSMIVVIIYTIFVLAYKYKRITFGVFIILISISVLAESTLASFNATATAGNSGRNDYPAQSEAVRAALSSIDSRDKDFYRLEMFRMYSANDPLLYGYRGITQFSSTANSKLNYFAKNMGMSADPGSNSNQYLPNTPILNGFFSVKYLLSKFDAVNLPNLAYNEISKANDVTILENKYSFPLGFCVNPKIKTLSLSDISPFDKQEKLINLASNLEEKIFSNIPVTTEIYDNMDRHMLENIRYHYKNIDASKVGKATLTYKIDKKQQVYVYMLNQTKTVTLTLNEKTSTYDTPRGVVMDLGTLDKNTEFTLSFEVPAAATGFFDIHVVAFNEEAFLKTKESLMDERLQLSHISDTRFEGKVIVKEECLLYTSIPYEEGWKVRVNGERVKTLSFKDAMLMVPLSPGEKTIEIYYSPQGFYLGLFLSGISFLILSILFIFEHYKKQNVKRGEVKK